MGISMEIAVEVTFESGDFNANSGGMTLESGILYLSLKMEIQWKIGEKCMQVVGKKGKLFLYGWTLESGIFLGAEGPQNAAAKDTTAVQHPSDCQHGAF